MIKELLLLLLLLPSLIIAPPGRGGERRREPQLLFGLWAGFIRKSHCRNEKQRAQCAINTGESGFGKASDRVKAKDHLRSLSEMEPSGVSVEVTELCTNKDHCQSFSVVVSRLPGALSKEGEKLGRWKATIGFPVSSPSALIKR